MAIGRTFVVGDVHGCLEELQALLRAARLSADDQLVSVGDLVAKGPDSRGVVQLCRERGALAVLGNHDAQVLAARAGKPVGKTHREVAASLAPEDWRWLERLPRWLELPQLTSLVVHAGLLPGVALAQQDPELLLNLRSFDEAGRPSKRVDGGTPWASRWPGPQLVVFGHDALRGLQRHPFAIGLDTGCVYGGQLTGLWLDTREVVQVCAQQVWREPDA